MKNFSATLSSPLPLDWKQLPSAGWRNNLQTCLDFVIFVVIFTHLSWVFDFLWSFSIIHVWWKVDWSPAIQYILICLYICLKSTGSCQKDSNCWGTPSSAHDHGLCTSLPVSSHAIGGGIACLHLLYFPFLQSSIRKVTSTHTWAKHSILAYVLSEQTLLSQVSLL